MTERVTNAIQALRDKADWLESLPEAKQEELGWEVSSSLALTFYAYSVEDAWSKRRLISGPNMTKEVTEEGTTWSREVTEHFTLRLFLSRAQTCEPIYETKIKTETIDEDRIFWDDKNQCWVMMTETKERVGWDCGSGVDEP